jgi:mono/diheme cytochrome c family protein
VVVAGDLLGRHCRRFLDGELMIIQGSSPSISTNCSMKSSRLGALGVFLLCATVGLLRSKAAAVEVVTAGTRVDFKRDIEPVFAANCHSCHGPKETKNGLRLDRRDRALAGGDSGPVILPGNSKGSVLIRYATGENDDKVIMPPKGERLSAAQIQLMRNWIDQGAEWPAGSEPELVKPSEHWAFKPLNRPAVPVPGGSVTSDRVVSEPVSARAIQDSAASRTSGSTALTTAPLNTDHWRRNPIDAFILAKLRNEGIAPSPEADRRTLIHRLCLDLLGLPPAPGEVDQFVLDPDPAAYERLVEHLLKSPHFGERWARHWLDVARYADSDGYEDDKLRPDAWRYRDWVIDTFNRDMPFDQFTVWQMAGDLLPDATYEQKLATGFHRMTLSNNAGAGGIQEEYRVKTVKDRLNTTAAAWLGLTVGCAECHSHKYDPISQREYYQLYAFFNNVEETAIPAPKPGGRYQREYEEATRAFDERLKKVRQALADYEKDVQPLRQREWEAGLLLQRTNLVVTGGLPDEVREAVLLPPDGRSEKQREALKNHFRSIDPEHAALKAVVPVGDEVGNNKPLPPSEKALVTSENAAPRKSFLQRKGNFEKPGAEVGPATPAFLPPLHPRGPGADRLDLARWIVDPQNPLTSRVAVNQIWQALFGQGLVTTPDNLGVKGERPSHPELLDWLATEFIARGWSRKEIIRLIVQSATYRQSSLARLGLHEKDPNNILLARQNRLRVEAECVRDLALAASGLLNPEVGGPSFQPPLPAAFTSAKELKNERFMEPSPASHRHRRGVYVNVQRTFLNPMMRTFDVADANVCTVRRERSNTPLQALTLLNDPVFFEAARALGFRVAREAPGSFAARLDRLYQLCLARPPRSGEAAALENLFAQQTALCRNDARAVDELLGGEAVPPAMDRVEAAAWVGIARTVLNLDEFITRE